MEFNQFYCIQRILGLVMVAGFLSIAAKGLPLSETTETDEGTSKCGSVSEYMATHESRRIVSALNKHEKLINRLQRSAKGNKSIKLSQRAIDYMTKALETVANPEPIEEITNLTCPFKYNFTFDLNRIPKNITTVECQGGCTEDPAMDCIPIVHYFTAIKLMEQQNGNNKMENGKKKPKQSVTFYREKIQVACVCAKRVRRKPKKAYTLPPLDRIN